VRFDAYILDVKGGPFANGEETRKRDPSFRRVWSLEKLSKFLVNVQSLKDGKIKLSSITFRRWLEEDAEHPDSPIYIDESEKPYQVHMKEKDYQEQCKKAKIPEEQYKVKFSTDK
jgi:hypothetical protein